MTEEYLEPVELAKELHIDIDKNMKNVKPKIQTSVELDNQCKWIVEAIVDKIKTHNIDWFLVIAGTEGVGKTTLALDIFAELCELNGYDMREMLETNLMYDEDEMLQFLSMLEPNKKYQPIMMDEGANILLNRESMYVKRAYILKFFNVMRFLNFITIICTPNFNFLDKNVREHRVKSMFYVPQRGVYWYYDKDQINRMIMNSGKGWKWAEPRFIGTYKVNRALEEITNDIKLRYIDTFKKTIAKFIKSHGKENENIIDTIKEEQTENGS